MPKSILISESGSLGFDLTVLEIYHTSITASNLIATISASALTGSQTLQIDNIPDSYETFWAQCTSGNCNGTTASLSVIGSGNPATRFFDVHSVSSTSTVEITTPIADGPSTTTLSQSVNFNDFTLFTIQANPTYPETFDGWYDSETGGNQWTSSNPLSIELNTFTGSDQFYARFS